MDTVASCLYDTAGNSEGFDTAVNMNCTASAITYWSVFIILLDLGSFDDVTTCVGIPFVLLLLLSA